MSSQRQSHDPHLFCLDLLEVIDEASFMLMEGAVSREISRTPIIAHLDF